MADFQTNWANARDTAGDIEIVPPAGEYHVDIISASAGVTRGDKELVKFKLRTDDRNTPGVFEQPLFCSTEFGVEQAAKALHGYGLDLSKVEEFSDLVELVPTLVGTRARVQVSWDGDFIRVAPLEILVKPERNVAVAAPSANGKADEDIPF